MEAVGDIDEDGMLDGPLLGPELGADDTDGNEDGCSDKLGRCESAALGNADLDGVLLGSTEREGLALGCVDGAPLGGKDGIPLGFEVVVGGSDIEGDSDGRELQ